MAVCYALELTDIKLFQNPLTLKQMRVFEPNIQLPQYYTYIKKESIIYNKIKQLNMQYYDIGKIKCEWAKNIGSHLNLQANTSPSFNYFMHKLDELCENSSL